MLARFERVLESAVEGGVRRVFPSKVQPVQLAKAAARAMEEAQVVGIRGTDVPNAYTVQVSPPDAERFNEYLTTLSEQIRVYLVEYAADRGFHLVADPRVAVEINPKLGTGTVRCTARYMDLEPGRESDLNRELEGTRALRVRPLASDNAPVVSGHGSLIDSFGTVHTLDPDGFVVRIGRATDNDITVASTRVSRYHAQLRWEAGRWVAHDLQSTNGTFVDTAQVSAPMALRDGSVLKLADYELTFRAGT